MDNRRLLLPAILGIAGLASAAVFLVAIQSSVRFTLWSTVAEWTPTKLEQRRLAECRPPGWWAWLKVVSKDRTVGCGEAWVAQALATKVKGDDRARWLQEWVASAESSPLRRLRSSLALAVAGRPTPLEPAWLSLNPELPTLPDPGLARGVAEEASWGVHLGPRWMALGQVWAMSVSGRGAQDVVPALEALWALQDPEIGRLAVSAVARGLNAPPDLLLDTQYRRRRGLHAGTLPDGWAEALGRRPTCEEPCLELWIELLQLEAEAAADEPMNDPLTAPTMEPLSGLLGYSGARGRALSWWIDATVAWVTASPEPERRLASLGLGSESGVPDPVAVVWERGGTPWMTAAVMSEVGRRSGIDVQVRSDAAGAVEVRVGSQRLTRAGCQGLPADGWRGEPWTVASIHAGALAEAALAAFGTEGGDEAARLAAAAKRLDQEVASELLGLVAQGELEAVPDRARGIEVGTVLARATPVRADDTNQVGRRAVGSMIVRGCQPE